MIINDINITIQYNTNQIILPDGMDHNDINT